MNPIRQVYDAVPDSLPVPPSMRRRRVEVVFLALDEDPAPLRADRSPEGLEQSAAALPELPEREDQGAPAALVPGSARGRLTIVEEEEAHLDDFTDYMP